MALGNWIKTILRLAGAGLLFLIVLELSARTDDAIKWGAPLFGYYSEELLSVSDSLGWHNRPNAQYQKWHINSYGFRGPEITLEKPHGVIRIVTVGASETFGLYESPGNDYPAQIQYLLDSLQPGRFQVLNAACPGMSPPRIDHYFKLWLNQFQPDILVYYPSPSMYLWRKPPADTVITRQQPPLPKFSLRLPGKVSIMAKQFLPEAIQLYLKTLYIARAIKNNPSDWVYKEIPSDRLPILDTQLRKLISDVQGQGTKVIVATHGTRISGNVSDEDKRSLIIMRKLAPHVEEHVFLDMEAAGNVVIRQIGIDMGVPVVDVDGLLEKSATNFADHLHFTDQGARAVAAAMVDAILKMTPSTQEQMAPQQ